MEARRQPARFPSAGVEDRIDGAGGGPITSKRIDTKRAGDGNITNNDESPDLPTQPGSLNTTLKSQA